MQLSIGQTVYLIGFVTALYNIISQKIITKTIIIPLRLKYSSLIELYIHSYMIIIFTLGSWLTNLLLLIHLIQSRKTQKYIKVYDPTSTNSR